MIAWRLSELRQTLLFVRGARGALAARDISTAFRYYSLALRGLSVLRGMACRPGGNPCATAGLLALVVDLEHVMERALRPARAVHPSELVAPIRESLELLRRAGVEVEDEVLAERARGIATKVGAIFRIEQLASH